MPSENEFLVEFPADRDYIPIIQSFLKDFLRNYDFSEDFSERATEESLLWFDAVIPKEKFLQALPAVFFRCKTSEEGLHVQIKTTDKKMFTGSLNLQPPGDIK